MPLSLKAISVVVCAAAVCALAQDAPHIPDVAHLNTELQQTRSELADSRHEIEKLRQSVEELRKLVQAGNSAGPSVAPNVEPTADTADQDVSFLAAKVNEMHQDKVESASKYPLKLSGLVLFNSYWNSGTLDEQTLPSLALPAFPGAPPPGVGATLNQTMLGLSATGPKLVGARTSAEVEVDFAGGNPTTSFGATAGLLRLRTARATLDWDHTSLTFGQDNLFFSPLSPTSYATVLEPAMSWSGNLWVWTPGIELTRRLALNESSGMVLQGGLLDPLTEEAPVFQGRDSTAGEASRAPAVAGRIAFEHSSVLYPLTIGFGGYRAQQQYAGFSNVASWTLNSDFSAGLGRHLQISGEWYKGQAVGGLGGGIWTSVVYPESTGPHSAIQPLRSTGGWTQLKIIPAARFEINGAYGQDENYGADLRVFPFSFGAAGFPAMQKNRTEFVNFIFKPSSVLLLAIEYRHLFTAPANAAGNTGDQLNLAAGVRF